MYMYHYKNYTLSGHYLLSIIMFQTHIDTVVAHQTTDDSPDIPVDWFQIDKYCLGNNHTAELCHRGSSLAVWGRFGQCFHV